MSWVTVINAHVGKPLDHVSQFKGDRLRRSFRRSQPEGAVNGRPRLSLSL
jgi:hypothetical protein